MSAPAIFRSVDHPDDASAALVYSREVARPMGFLMLPVMIVALVQALQEASVFPEIFIAAGGALVLASGWTHFQLDKTIVELRVRGHRIAARSALDVARDRPVQWDQLMRAKQQRDGLHVYAGDYTFRIHRVDWPEYSRIQTALQPDDQPEQARCCPY